ncbi:hypothetical protein L9F63_018480, partial [Diploptera punctata]
VQLQLYSFFPLLETNNCQTTKTILLIISTQNITCHYTFPIFYNQIFFIFFVYYR